MADEITPPAGQAPAPEGTPAPAAPVPKWRNPHAKPAAKPAPQAQAATPEAPAPAGEAPKPAKVSIPGKIAKELEQLRALKAEHDKLTVARGSDVKRIERYAETELSLLTEEQRAYVKEVAGKDPGAQLDLVASMRKHKLLGVAPTAPAKPDATTAPKGGPPASRPAPEDKLAKYEALAKSAPINAAAFLAANRPEIEAARKARGAN